MFYPTIASLPCGSGGRGLAQATSQGGIAQEGGLGLTRIVELGRSWSPSFSSQNNTTRIRELGAVGACSPNPPCATTGGRTSGSPADVGPLAWLGATQGQGVGGMGVARTPTWARQTEVFIYESQRLSTISVFHTCSIAALAPDWITACTPSGGCTCMCEGCGVARWMCVGLCLLVCVLGHPASPLSSG